jgi:hypothetical protein
MAAAEIRMDMAGAHMKLRTVALNLCDIFSAVAGLLRRPVPVDCVARSLGWTAGRDPLSFFSHLLFTCFALPLHLIYFPPLCAVSRSFLAGKLVRAAPHSRFQVRSSSSSTSSGFKFVHTTPYEFNLRKSCNGVFEMLYFFAGNNLVFV